MKITIFWLAGSGTSTVGKKLAEVLDYTFMSTGNIFRQFAADAGMNLYDFENTIAKKDLNFDKKLDAQTAKYGQENENFIFESRLAWHFIPDSFKIFLDCNTIERYRRIHEREWWDLEEISFHNIRREQELIERYAIVYPEIIFPPTSEDFDLYIDASNITPDEIVENILSKIQ